MWVLVLIDVGEAFGMGHSSSAVLRSTVLRSISLVVLIGVSLSVSGCQDQWWHNLPGWGGYWWQRGQPKGVNELLTDAQHKLELALSGSADERQEIIPTARGIQQSLTKAVEYTRAGRASTDVLSELNETERQMMQLEGKLSVGSRAAYGELAAQLRQFTNDAQSGHPANEGAFGLFASRTFVFLASELSMPPPVLL